MAEELENQEGFEPEGQRVDTSNAKCPNCGSELSFDPVSQELKCPSCGQVTKFGHVKGQVKHKIIQTNEDIQAHDEWASQLKTVQCQTCGAKIMLTGLQMTSVCPYCGSDYVVESKALSGLKPDVVIPFAFDVKECAVRFAKGIRKKFFAPMAFKRNLPENQIHGIYVPMFTFDADTVTNYNGTLEKKHTHHNGKHTYTTVEHIHISGTKEMTHRNYVIETSSKMNQKQMVALLPYDMDCSYQFDENYLRGFSVEHYEDSLRSCYDAARTSMEEAIKKSILNEYTYDSVESFHATHHYSNEYYSYRLAPVYCVECEYKGKKYMTQVNGQTGKIGLGYPISMLKKVIVYALIGLAVAAAFAGIFYLAYLAAND